MLNEKLKQIRQTKELEYGSFENNMTNIGRMWSSLLGLKKDIPGHLVANMYVAAKLIRTRQSFKQDTYDDAANYLHQAELMQKKDQEPTDANERMYESLNQEHKTNYPKDEELQQMQKTCNYNRKKNLLLCEMYAQKVRIR